MKVFILLLSTSRRICYMFFSLNFCSALTHTRRSERTAKASETPPKFFSRPSNETWFLKAFRSRRILIHLVTCSSTTDIQTTDNASAKTWNWCLFSDGIELLFSFFSLSSPQHSSLVDGQCLAWLWIKCWNYWKHNQITISRRVGLFGDGFRVDHEFRFYDGTKKQKRANFSIRYGKKMWWRERLADVATQQDESIREVCCWDEIDEQFAYDKLLASGRISTSES